MGDRHDVRRRTPPREFTSRRSVLLRGGEVTVDTLSETTDLLPSKEQDRRRSSAVGSDETVVDRRRWLVVPRRDAPSRAYQLSCRCSYKVRCEVMRHGERLGELTFFDDEEASVTQGERVR